MNVLVILCTYNGENFIKEQLMSIINQNNVNVEILVFDDLSSDSTISIINGLKLDFDNIRIFQNQFSSGSAAINFCNSVKSLSDDILSKYNYIALADQDDIWLPNKLRYSVDKLMSMKASLYSSNLILWDQLSSKKRILKKDFPQKKFDFLFEGASAGCTYVFTNQFALKLKYKLLNVDYLNWKNFSHDWFIYFFARLNHFHVYIDNKQEILYRIHDNNVHGQLNKPSLSSIYKRLILINNGWYSNQIIEFNKLLNENSVEFEIYKLYTRDLRSRIKVLLKFNFQLIRSKRKFFYFFILSLFFFKPWKK